MTGAALAASPPCPQGLVFEYMFQGSVVQLRTAALLQPGKPTRFEFVVFGGGYPDDNPTPTTPCADIAVSVFWLCAVRAARCAVCCVLCSVCCVLFAVPTNSTAPPPNTPK